MAFYYLNLSHVIYGILSFELESCDFMSFCSLNLSHVIYDILSFELESCNLLHCCFNIYVWTFFRSTNYIRCHYNRVYP